MTRVAESTMVRSVSEPSLARPLLATERPVSAGNLTGLLADTAADAGRLYDFGPFTMRVSDFSKLDKFREHMAEFGNVQGLKYEAFLKGLHAADPRLHEQPNPLKEVLGNWVNELAGEQIREAKAYARENFLGVVQEKTDRGAWTDLNVTHLSERLAELAADSSGGQPHGSGFQLKPWHLAPALVGGAALGGAGAWGLSQLIAAEHSSGEANGETGAVISDQIADPDHQYVVPHWADL